MLLFHVWRQIKLILKSSTAIKLILVIHRIHGVMFDVVIVIPLEYMLQIIIKTRRLTLAFMRLKAAVLRFVYQEITLKLIGTKYKRGSCKTIQNEI